MNPTDSVNTNHVNTTRGGASLIFERLVALLGTYALVGRGDNRQSPVAVEHQYSVLLQLLEDIVGVAESFCPPQNREQGGL